MPVLTGPSCLTSESCPQVLFPSTPAICSCDLATGGVNDLYFIPCSSELTEVNLTDLAWWNTLVNGDNTTDPVTPVTLGRVGVGLGSISKKSSKSERIGSCRTQQMISMTWALKYQIKCFDKTNADTTRTQMNALISSFNKFVLVARMCDGDDSVLPVGVFTTSDFNWTVPDNFEDIQMVEVEMSWIEMALPKVYSIAGLSAILPKAA